MAVQMMLFLSISLFSGHLLAGELSIDCEQETGGHAEVRTYQGGTRKMLDPTRAFSTSIDEELYLIWGYATGGGDTGDYVDPGAIVRLLEDGQISLEQEGMSERLVPEGKYTFAMFRGYSITCDLTKR